MTELDKLFKNAKDAYEAWADAQERRDEDLCEATSYDESMRRGIPVLPSVLTPPAPNGAVEKAKNAYVEALSDFEDAVQDAMDDLPDHETDAPESIHGNLVGDHDQIITAHMARCYSTEG